MAVARPYAETAISVLAAQLTASKNYIALVIYGQNRRFVEQVLSFFCFCPPGDIAQRLYARTNFELFDFRAL